MKTIKSIVKLLLWIVGVVVVLVLALPLWIGPVVKIAANAIVPKKTGTAFNLGAFALNPYTGKLSVGDMQLWNPQGFDQKMAATLGSFDVVVDAPSLAGDVIVVKDIELKDVFVSYVSNGSGENNFAIIKKNAAGNEEMQVKGEQGGASSSAQPSQPSQPHQSPQPSKKVIIDHLLIANVMVQLGPISLPMPNIELTGIGRKDGGAAMQEAWEQVYAQILQSFNAIGVNLNGLVKGLGNIKVDQVLKNLDAVKNLDAKHVTDAVNAGVGIMNAATGKTLGTVNTGVGKTTEAVSGAATKTVDTAKEGVDKTIEKATETINALKSLF